MIYGILLAAGRSIRFGGNKLTHPFNTNRCIAIQSAINLAHSVDKCITVIQPNDYTLEKELIANNIDFIHCKFAYVGMAESIKCGILNSVNADGWIIALADMPYVKKDTLIAISSSLKSNQQIVAPYHKNKRGNPVGFGKVHKTNLLELKGDKGAKIFLKKNEELIYKLQVNDDGIFKDIDYLDDVIMKI